MFRQRGEQNFPAPRNEDPEEVTFVRESPYSAMLEFRQIEDAARYIRDPKKKSFDFFHRSDVTRKIDVPSLRANPINLDFFFTIANLILIY